MRISVVIPALNEADAIGAVLAEIPDWVGDVIVIDNGSMDQTAEIARAAGARVCNEARRGYGYACMTGVLAAPEAEVIVFLDGDYSDFPQEMGALVTPIVEGQADLVIGSRLRGKMQPGAMLPHAYFANILFSRLLRALCGLQVTDIGPFRAITRQSFMNLELQEFTYGWTLEMMIKAARHGLRVIEVPVSYRKRLGHSKVSGSLLASLKAGVKMIWTLRYCFE